MTDIRDEPAQGLLDFVLDHAQVTTVHCTRQDRGSYVQSGRALPNFSYIFVQSGRLNCVVGEESCVLASGDLAVIPPATWHRASSHGQPVLLGSIQLAVTMPGGVDAFDLLAPSLVRRVAAGSRLGRYVDGFFAEWDRDDTRMRDVMLRSWTRLVTLELLYHDAAQGLLRRRTIDPLVAALLEELNRDPGRRITLDGLATLSGFSAQHINRRFREVVGMTPLRYLERVRMEAAARMLSEGGRTVRAVARELGFNDPYYFSRVFTRHFGQSPSRWRGQLAAPASPTHATNRGSPDAQLPGEYLGTGA